MSKPVQCKRCGDVNVAWVQSKRTGRYYLAMTVRHGGIAGDYTQGIRGKAAHTEVLAHRPHKCDPEKVEKFQAEIAGYAKARGVTVEEWWQGK